MLGQGWQREPVVGLFQLQLTQLGPFDQIDSAAIDSIWSKSGPAVPASAFIVQLQSEPLTEIRKKVIGLNFEVFLGTSMYF